MKKLIITAILVLAAATANAVTLDLTTAGAFGTINGGIFQQTSPQPTGTGFIDSFLRLQSPGNTSFEQGYNTSARISGQAPFDALSGNFTRDLTLSEVGVVNGYRAFLLDINEPTNAPLISLDSLQIYLGNVGGIFLTSTAQLSTLGTLIYDLDAGGNNNILLNAALNPGSGIGDMLAFIPDSLFTGGTFVYLYSAFTNAQGGFEEWASITSNIPAPVPEPGTVVLLGFGVLGVAIFTKRRMGNTQTQAD